jgi:tellurium resistance protein TerZ
MDGDDGLTMKLLALWLFKTKPSVSSVAFVLNSFQDTILEQFHLPSIRTYEGTPKSINEVFAKFWYHNGSGLVDMFLLVMGVFYKKNGEWKFNAIANLPKIKKTRNVSTVTNQYL